MPPTTDDDDGLGVGGVHTELERLRHFAGTPSEFWPAYTAAMCRLTGATGGEIQVRQGDSDWKTIARYPLRVNRGGLPPNGWREQALKDGMVTVRGSGGGVLAVDLTPPESTASVVGLFYTEADESALKVAASMAGWGRGVPASFTMGRRLERAEETVSSFAAALDLLRVLDSRRRYLEAAMTLCNEAAARFTCDRVSFGWLDKGNMRLQAISHTEKFEKKMQIVIDLEEVMEESLDQDEEVIVPVPDGNDAVTRCHERFAAAQGGTNLASLPLRRADEPVGVLTLERASVEFDEAEIRSLRLLCDQVATRLGELRKHDRWIGARAWASCREKAAKLVGVEHTGWKLIGLAVAVALAVLIFGGSIYRVEAPFILKSDTLTQMPAAFDGYIEEVHYHVGDAVAKGQPLVDIDRRELLLEEASAVAELRRHRSDARRAEAEGDLAKMRGSMALADQAEATLEVTRYRLSQTRIEAPFDGVVVEGDLRERIGSPVRKGEVMLKVARLDPMYVEGKVEENNIHLLEEGKAGEIAFASRPDEKFPVVVERIEPLAVPEEGGNIFIVRCRIEGGAPGWWRPGMSGLCKIETERRSYLWMLTRRTIDFLRMKLWW